MDCVGHNKCKSFDDYVRNHVPENLSWGDKDEMICSLENRRAEIDEMINKKDTKKSKKIRYTPCTTISVIVEKKPDQIPAVVKKQQPPPTQIQRPDKPICNKGPKCCNRKCTFKHPERAEKQLHWPILK